MSRYNLNEIRERPLIKKSALTNGAPGDITKDQCFLVVPVGTWNQLNNIMQSYNEALLEFNKQYSLAVLEELNRTASDIYYWSQTRHNYYHIGQVNSVQNYPAANALLTVSVGGVPKQVAYNNICPNTTDYTEQTPTEEELSTIRQEYSYKPSTIQPLYTRRP